MACGQHSPSPVPLSGYEGADTRRDTVMDDRMQYSEDDPRHHVIKLREMLTGVMRHARKDVDKISEPKAQALFETTAEVCQGLMTAFDHYEQKAPAWKR